MEQYVTFELDEALFGVNVYYALEINSVHEYTVVPGPEDHIHGFINLRGEIVTMFNLRRRLGLEDRPIDESAVNLILRTEDEVSSLPVGRQLSLPIGNDRVGLIVGAVGDILQIDEDAIERTPAVDHEKYDIRFVSSVCQLEDKVLMILDVEQMINARDDSAEQAVSGPISEDK